MYFTAERNREREKRKKERYRLHFRFQSGGRGRERETRKVGVNAKYSLFSLVICNMLKSKLFVCIC